MLSETSIFHAHMDIAYLVYGFAFVAMALVIAMRRERDSHLELGSVLWLLAAFGFSHGILEWTDLWLLVHGPSPRLAMAQPPIILLSYLFLFGFGRRLVLMSLSAQARSSPACRLLSIWVYAPLLGGLMLAMFIADQSVLTLNIAARYLFGFFGALLTGLGFYLHWRNCLAPTMPTSDLGVVRVGSWLAAAAFIAYAVLGGLITPRADWFPAAVINQESFLEVFHVPVQMLRAVCAVSAAIAVGALLRIFHLEGLHRMRDSLRTSQQALAELRIAATAFEAQEGMVIADRDCLIVRVNQSFTNITGYSAEEAVGRKTNLLKSGRQDDAFYAAMWESIVSSGNWHGEIWNRRKNGEVYPEWLTITAVRSDDGEIANYVGTMTDITASKAAEEQIQHLAFYDPLTLLPNRRLLHDRLRQCLAASIRTGREGALLFIDLDNFKTLNDTKGHDSGDLLLQQVAPRLSACIREGDTVARLGGDEFVVMLTDLSANIEEAGAQTKVVGDKILAALNLPYRLAGSEYHGTSSIGATLFRPPDKTVDELLKRADLAMYQAKDAGRDCLRFFNPEMQAKLTARAALESDLRDAIGYQQFVLHYQAQVDSSGRLIGAEALVRWQHHGRGMVPPSEFIPLAEESGMILSLGRWVLETACRQLVAWAQQPELRHLTIAVNVSARQFALPDFVDLVLALLEHTGADPRKLKLELTESLLVDNAAEVIGKMNALKARQVGFSLDDFGTGCSSLSYLKRLPLDQLKIDKSFVRDVFTDPNDAAIVRTIVALARSLGMSVIAEGVETPEQRDFLAREGCHAYQGYLFGRPGPAEAIAPTAATAPA